MERAQGTLAYSDKDHDLLVLETTQVVVRLNAQSSVRCARKMPQLTVVWPVQPVSMSVYGS